MWTFFVLVHLDLVLLVLVTVHIGQAVDPDAVLRDFLEDPGLELLDLCHGEAVRLGDDRHDGDLQAGGQVAGLAPAVTLLDSCFMKSMSSGLRPWP